MANSIVYFRLYDTQVGRFIVRYKDDFVIFWPILDEICKIWTVLRPITVAVPILKG